MQKVTPFLWFDDKAEEAMRFYVSIFKNSRVGSISRYGDAGPGPKGTVMVATFQLDGQEFMALNGGEMMQDKDTKKSQSVMKAMLQMTKIDTEGLKQAYEHAEK